MAHGKFSQVTYFGIVLQAKQDFFATVKTFHYAVRLVSIVLELAIGISYIKNVANFM